MNINSNYFANPFIKKDFISKELLNGIMRNLKIKAQSLDTNKTLKVQNIKNKPFIRNWADGIKFLSKNQIKNLENSNYGKDLKFITANSYEINPKNLTLDSGLIFEPSKCNAKLLHDKEYYLYHFFHVDSCKRFKLLIALDDSFNEEYQFSYINNLKVKKNVFYYINTIMPGILIRLVSGFLRKISFNIISLNLQPPRLSKIFQNKNIFNHYKNLKKGDFLIFNNLHPHSSHIGNCKYKARILQLVYK